MSESAVPESILIADCGAVATKVGLVDRVGREFRLLGVGRAQTTSEPPTSDLSVGVLRATAELEILTGRRLLTEQAELILPERASGEGADAFVATTSAGLPLRAAVVGLSRDFSVRVAQRALASTDTVIEHTIAVDEETGRWGTTARDGRAGGPSAAVEKLAALRPDVIVMVGGVDGGALTPLWELASIVAGIGAAMEEGTRPLIIFAGNREAREGVAARIGTLMELRTVDNVLPALEVENVTPLQAELGGILDERRAQIPGLAKLSAWSELPVLSTATSYELIARFLAKRFGLRVLAVDLGGAALVAIHATPGRTQRVVGADAGLAYGLDQLFERLGVERLARWLPPGVALEDAQARLWNQALRPWTIPTTPEDAAALNAAAREALRLHAPASTGPTWDWDADLVLLSGAPVARGFKPNALALIALDALPLRGIFSLAADATGLAPALGAAATVNAEAAAQVIEHDGFVTLGTALVPVFSPLLGEGVILQARVETADSGQLQVQVAAGTLELIPLGLGEKARVELLPARGVDLNVPLKNGALKREMEGGAVGLIIDARGRPLHFADTLDQQRARAQRWMWEIGA